jgi:ribosome modulation factor
MKAIRLSVAREEEVLAHGRRARFSGETLESCSYGHLNPLASFWKAGWHDADIELGSRITNFHPTTKQEAA